jgi:hypothetical protein
LKAGSQEGFATGAQRQSGEEEKRFNTEGTEFGHEGHREAKRVGHRDTEAQRRARKREEFKITQRPACGRQARRTLRNAERRDSVYA